MDKLYKYKIGEEVANEQRETANVTGTQNIDWSKEVFDFTMTSDTTFSDVNLPTGTDSKETELILDGAFTPTPPVYWTGFDYDGTYTRYKLRCVIGTSGSEEVRVFKLRHGDGGGVQSVTGTAVDNTDPVNPIVNIPANSGGGEIVYNVKDYGAKGDGIDLTDGNIFSGSVNFSSASASFVTSDVGKTIAIYGAATGGGFLVTTISAYTDANTVVLSTAAGMTVSGGAKWFYGTDDTVAIQTLLQTVFDAGGGVVYFPKSIYVISGALQTSVGAYNVNPNSQLWIPYDNSEFTDVRNRPAIELRGESPAILDQGSALIGRVASNRGSILRSTIQGSGVEPSVIANKGGAPNDNTNKSRTNLFVKNIGIQLTPNTSNKVTMGGINARHSSIANFEDVTAYPYALNLMSEINEPDVIDCTGIIMPDINAEHINSLTRTHCGGFTHGYKLGEHATAYNAIAMCCVNGFTLTETGQSAIFQKISAFWCKYDINIPSGTNRAYFKIDFLLSEWRQAGKWYDSVALIKDFDNDGMGEVTFDIIAAGIGLDNEKFKRVGAEKVITKPNSVDPFNSITTTDYTLKYIDGRKFIDCFHGTLAQTITVPNSTDVHYDRNTRIVVNRNGPADVFIQGATGVELQFPSGFTAGINQQYDAVELVYRGNNKWALYGALKPV